jgi:hypothetical protein
LERRDHAMWRGREFGWNLIRPMLSHKKGPANVRWSGFFFNFEKNEKPWRLFLTIV